jgi:GNAT superfamily N-acetyltransferase
VEVSIRPLAAADLDPADHVFRLAFGTFLGLPEPLAFAGDADYVRTRWRADPESAFAADVDGELAGSNFATRWGSFGFFGPLTVHPGHWNRGVAQRLLEVTMHRFEEWSVRHAALFTFPQSTKHVGLYQKFGFWPRFLTAVMAKRLEGGAASDGPLPSWERVAEGRVRVSGIDGVIAACREVTDEIFPGLDVSQEIRAVADQSLGETVLVESGSRLDGFAVCHVGRGSEAGSGNAYLKFAAVRPGSEATATFERLLSACETFAASNGASQLVAGVSTARHAAYRTLLGRGFRTIIQGVTMHRPNEIAYDREDALVLDDLR